MNNRLCTALIGLLLFSGGMAFAQSQPITQGAKKNAYLQGATPLMPRDLLRITKAVPPAYQEMRKAKSNYDAGSVFAYAGGFLVGFHLGQVLGGDDVEWGVLGVGTGVALLSIPFFSTYAKRTEKAVELYNSGIAGLPQRQRPVFRAGIGNGGISLSVRF